MKHVSSNTAQPPGNKTCDHIIVHIATEVAWPQTTSFAQLAPGEGEILLGVELHGHLCPSCKVIIADGGWPLCIYI